ncbi:peptide chain release factor family protein [Gloeobacter kilaueensis]|uniref:Peptide chain release factor 2 n=1 Tax=Gloeobacter kilaueensis (strain ATCC BAA-2537 / CCAP 1431/1 / ULC 316 / JS1) TaxID=1183438 RepID=U5QP93_GLOK1|nr:peptide chain release factor-like protein [Gloeobacter kilaueensis]AGY60718.1 peptide chain release factor 2 [Gloeobacter kilaueensis JS1]
MEENRPVYPTDRTSLERDCALEFVVAGGPGGQHRNKTESGVRLTHKPSGTVVLATERRSQHQNREVAFERMAAKLARGQQIQPPRKPTRLSKAAKARILEAKRRRSALKRERTSRVEID